MNAVAPDWAHHLPLALARLKAKGSTGALVKLRRALRYLPEHADPSALPYVVPYVRPWRAAQDAGLLTAGLWAQWHAHYHQPVAGRLDVGAALARIQDERASERHISALVRAAPAALPRRLSAAVETLAGEHVALDWPRLHADIAQLMAGRCEGVHRRWLTGFYFPVPVTEVESLRAHP